jgi:ATP phosphoribosyltransferase regulatory subunit
MTFRVTDQLSGRLMGIRADITPQTARMDAHSLRRQGPSRLCYAGTVLHTRPRGPLESRTPISIGVELFGEAALSADIEVIELFLQTLKTSGVNQVHLDVGHVDIFRGLLAGSHLDADSESRLFELLQRKASAELNDWINLNVSDKKLGGWLKALPGLAGSIEVIGAAKKALKGAPIAVMQAINELEEVVDSVAKTGVSIHIDLGELPGYHYHTGVVFAGYVQGYGKALGNGGRYDHVGEAFGRSRPATGFAFDLKSLVAQGQRTKSTIAGIFVPYTSDNECHHQVAVLRSQGNRVVQGFQNQIVDLSELKCDRQLVNIDGKYVIQSVT